MYIKRKSQILQKTQIMCFFICVIIEANKIILPNQRYPLVWTKLATQASSKDQKTKRERDNPIEKQKKRKKRLIQLFLSPQLPLLNQSPSPLLPKVQKMKTKQYKDRVLGRQAKIGDAHNPKHHIFFLPLLLYLFQLLFSSLTIRVRIWSSNKSPLQITNKKCIQIV